MLISSPDRRWLAAFSLVGGESAQRTDRRSESSTATRAAGAQTISVSAEAAGVASLLLGTTGLVAAAYNLSLATTYCLTCLETAKAEVDLAP